MQADEFRQLNDADLAARIGEMEREQFNLRFRSASGPLEDPLRLRAIRRDIARLKTVQRERVASSQAAAAPARGKRNTTAAKAATGARSATRGGA